MECEKKRHVHHSVHLCHLAFYPKGQFSRYFGQLRASCQQQEYNGRSIGRPKDVHTGTIVLNGDRCGKSLLSSRRRANARSKRRRGRSTSLATDHTTSTASPSSLLGRYLPSSSRFSISTLTMVSLLPLLWPARQLRLLMSVATRSRLPLPGLPFHRKAPFQRWVSRHRITTDLQLRPQGVLGSTHPTSCTARALNQLLGPTRLSQTLTPPVVPHNQRTQPHPARPKSTLKETKKPPKPPSSSCSATRTSMWIGRGKRLCELSSPTLSTKR